ncbi:hypothetical protein D3C81_2055840 [compost metagenome]
MLLVFYGKLFDDFLTCAPWLSSIYGLKFENVIKYDSQLIGRVKVTNIVSIVWMPELIERLSWQFLIVQRSQIVLTLLLNLVQHGCVFFRKLCSKLFIYTNARVLHVAEYWD